MPKVAYSSKIMTPDRMIVVHQANEIITGYQAQGLDLTLRQLYYQFVTRNWITNEEKSYKKLGDIVSDGRMCGHIDWDSIKDRGRNVAGGGYYQGPDQVGRGVGLGYILDRWRNQDRRIEVWVEKEALAGVVQRPAGEFNVSYFSCKGYTSQSEMWAAAMRLLRYARTGQRPLILHLGDHDPSGLDMTRDIRERLDTFMAAHGYSGPEVRRIALNMDQIQLYDPPPNPAKVTDSRFASYQAEYGEESWELDALEPTVLMDLIRQEIEAERDPDALREAIEEEQHDKKLFSLVRDRWSDVLTFVSTCDVCGRINLEHDDDCSEAPIPDEDDDETEDDDDDY